MSSFDNLENALNVPATIEPSKEIVIPEKDIVEVDNDERKDFKYARRTLKDVVDQGNDAIASLMEIAQSSEDSRVYRVVGELIKAVTEATEKLYGIHKTAAEIHGGNQMPSNMNIDKAVFVGTTAELLEKFDDRT